MYFLQCHSFVTNIVHGITCLRHVHNCNTHLTPSNFRSIRHRRMSAKVIMSIHTPLSPILIVRNFARWHEWEVFPCSSQHSLLSTDVAVTVQPDVDVQTVFTIPRGVKVNATVMKMGNCSYDRPAYSWRPTLGLLGFECDSSLGYWYLGAFAVSISSQIGGSKLKASRGVRNIRISGSWESHLGGFQVRSWIPQPFYFIWFLEPVAVLPES